MGSIKKEVGTTVSKGGHNDLRKTNLDVNIVDGKLDLNTHTEIMTEEANPVRKSMRIKPSAFKYLVVVQKGDAEPLEVALFKSEGDAQICARALNKSSSSEYKYRITDKT